MFRLPLTFQGDVEAICKGAEGEPDEGFEMCFERLILREDEVSYEGSGTDSEGRFEFRGTATRSSDAPYIGPVTVEYPSWSDPNTRERRPWQGTGELSFDMVKPTRAGRRCNVRGKWFQEPYESMFEGTLDAFRIS